MLVLSRKVGEQVIIANNIRVQVLSVRGNRVRLGFQAPDEVCINREEICFEVPMEAPLNVAEPMIAGS